MGRFGFKKSNDEDDDSSRRALFGSRSKDKDKSPAPAANPYAKPIPIDAYTKAKVMAGAAPVPENFGGPGGPVNEKGPVGNQQGGYGPNRFGGQSGYGGDRFGGSGGGGAASRYGPGGYGGLGSADPNDPGDANRDALFGNAAERNQRQPNGAAPPPYSQGANDGGYGGASGGGDYDTGTYQERVLTAEEEEEEEIKAIKQDMRFIKQGDVASTRNALRAAAMAEETGRNTLARLGAQGERIHDTEKYLDVASSQNRIAEEKARELATLNKSMFAVHVSNPFTKNARRRERDEKILATHREERATREDTQKEAFLSNQRMERTFREIEREAAKNGGKSQKNMTERAKYQFEADSEDEAMEDEIEQNLDLLSGAASRLNGLARATGKELEEQNKHLDRIMGKSDYVDDQIAMNRARLDRIR